MSAITAQVEMKVQATELFTEVEMPGATDRSVTYSGFSYKERLKSDTVPVAEKLHNQSGVGPVNLDLTALVRDIGATQDMTGLALQVLQFNNTDDTLLVISDGAANPYPVNAGLDITIEPGAKALFMFEEQLAAVSPTVKMLDITATAAKTWELLMIFGTNTP